MFSTDHECEEGSSFMQNHLIPGIPATAIKAHVVDEGGVECNMESVVQQNMFFNSTDDDSEDYSSLNEMTSSCVHKNKENLPYYDEKTANDSYTNASTSMTSGIKISNNTTPSGNREFSDGISNNTSSTYNCCVMIHQGKRLSSHTKKKNNSSQQQLLNSLSNFSIIDNHYQESINGFYSDDDSKKNINISSLLSRFFKSTDLLYATKLVKNSLYSTSHNSSFSSLLLNSRPITMGDHLILNNLDGATKFSSDYSSHLLGLPSSWSSNLLLGPPNTSLSNSIFESNDSVFLLSNDSTSKVNINNINTTSHDSSIIRRSSFYDSSSSFYDENFASSYNKVMKNFLNKEKKFLMIKGDPTTSSCTTTSTSEQIVDSSNNTILNKKVVSSSNNKQITSSTSQHDASTPNCGQSILDKKISETSVKLEEVGPLNCSSTINNNNSTAFYPLDYKGKSSITPSSVTTSSFRYHSSNFCTSYSDTHNSSSNSIKALPYVEESSSFYNNNNNDSILRMKTPTNELLSSCAALTTTMTPNKSSGDFPNSVFYKSSDFPNSIFQNYFQNSSKKNLLVRAMANAPPEVQLRNISPVLGARNFEAFNNNFSGSSFSQQQDRHFWKCGGGGPPCSTTVGLSSLANETLWTISLGPSLKNGTTSLTKNSCSSSVKNHFFKKSQQYSLNSTTTGGATLNNRTFTNDVVVWDKEDKTSSSIIHPSINSRGSPTLPTYNNTSRNTTTSSSSSYSNSNDETTTLHFVQEPVEKISHYIKEISTSAKKNNKKNKRSFDERFNGSSESTNKRQKFCMDPSGNINNVANKSTMVCDDSDLPTARKTNKNNGSTSHSTTFTNDVVVLQEDKKTSDHHVLSLFSSSSSGILFLPSNIAHGIKSDDVSAASGVFLQVCNRSRFTTSSSIRRSSYGRTCLDYCEDDLQHPYSGLDIWSTNRLDLLDDLKSCTRPRINKVVLPPNNTEKFSTTNDAEENGLLFSVDVDPLLMMQLQRLEKNSSTTRTSLNMLSLQDLLSSRLSLLLGGSPREDCSMTTNCCNSRSFLDCSSALVEQQTMRTTGGAALVGREEKLLVRLPSCGLLMDCANVVCSTIVTTSQSNCGNLHAYNNNIPYYIGNISSHTSSIEALSSSMSCNITHNNIITPQQGRRKAQIIDNSTDIMLNNSTTTTPKEENHFRSCDNIKSDDLLLPTNNISCFGSTVLPSLGDIVLGDDTTNKTCWTTKNHHSKWTTTHGPFKKSSSRSNNCTTMDRDLSLLAMDETDYLSLLLRSKSSVASKTQQDTLHDVTSSLIFSLLSFLISTTAAMKICCKNESCILLGPNNIASGSNVKTSERNNIKESLLRNNSNNNRVAIAADSMSSSLSGCAHKDYVSNRLMCYSYIVEDSKDNSSHAPDERRQELFVVNNAANNGVDANNPRKFLTMRKSFVDKDFDDDANTTNITRASSTLLSSAMEANSSSSCSVEINTWNPRTMSSSSGRKGPEEQLHNSYWKILARSFSGKSQRCILIVPIVLAIALAILLLLISFATFCVFACWQSEPSPGAATTGIDARKYGAMDRIGLRFPNHIVFTGEGHLNYGAIDEPLASTTVRMRFSARQKSVLISLPWTWSYNLITNTTADSFYQWCRNSTTSNRAYLNDPLAGAAGEAENNIFFSDGTIGCETTGYPFLNWRSFLFDLFTACYHQDHDLRVVGPLQTIRVAFEKRNFHHQTPTTIGAFRSNPFCRDAWMTLEHSVFKVNSIKNPTKLYLDAFSNVRFLQLVADYESDGISSGSRLLKNALQEEEQVENNLFPGSRADFDGAAGPWRRSKEAGERISLANSVFYIRHESGLPYLYVDHRWRGKVSPWSLCAATYGNSLVVSHWEPRTPFPEPTLSSSYRHFGYSRSNILTVGGYYESLSEKEAFQKLSLLEPGTGNTNALVSDDDPQLLRELYADDAFPGAISRETAHHDHAASKSIEKTALQKAAKKLQFCVDTLTQSVVSFMYSAQYASPEIKNLHLAQGGNFSRFDGRAITIFNQFHKKTFNKLNTALDRQSYVLTGPNSVYETPWGTPTLGKVIMLYPDNGYLPFKKTVNLTNVVSAAENHYTPKNNTGTPREEGQNNYDRSMSASDYEVVDVLDFIGASSERYLSLWQPQIAGASYSPPWSGKDTKRWLKRCDLTPDIRYYSTNSKSSNKNASRTSSYFHGAPLTTTPQFDSNLDGWKRSSASPSASTTTSEYYDDNCCQYTSSLMWSLVTGDWQSVVTQRNDTIVVNAISSYAISSQAAGMLIDADWYKNAWKSQNRDWYCALINHLIIVILLLCLIIIAILAAAIIGVSLKKHYSPKTLHSHSLCSSTNASSRKTTDLIGSTKTI